MWPEVWPRDSASYAMARKRRYSACGEATTSSQEFASQQPCQAITACGMVAGDEVYQHEMFPGFIPYRRDIEWQTPVREVPLDVLRTLPGWREVATKLRFGHVELPPELFQAIRERMQPGGG